MDGQTVVPAGAVKFSSSRLAFVLILATTAARAVAAEEELPILQTRSNVLTVVDGDHVKRDYWLLMPERNPDIYYVEIPLKPHDVTFQSDVGELTFPAEFGDKIDFVIQQDGMTGCRTQIRADFKKLQPFTREPSAPATSKVEIPFTLGDNDKMYVKGRLNGGEEQSFQFDLGCGGSVIKESSTSAAKMKLDSTITLSNSDGVNQVPYSTSNHLEIAGLHWRDLPFAVADNMTHREDCLLGNTLFQDKVVEIDYGKGVLVIHDALPAIDPAYSKHDIILDGVIPFVQGSLTIAGERREGWFMLDTGAYTSILYSDRASPWNKLIAELRNIFGSDEPGPRLTIGEHAFSDFNYTVDNGSRNNDQLGLLGNDILKRFNTILDNQNGSVYLRPNSLAEAPYRNPEYYLARGVVAGGIALTAWCGLFFYRRRRRRARKDAPLDRESQLLNSPDL
jgi:hypothetical protein